MQRNEWRSTQQRRRGRSSVREAGMWASIAGGGALAVMGLARRSWPGAAMAAAGGAMIAGGVKTLRDSRPQTIAVERSVLVNRPIEEVYQFWRNLENLPQFMRHLKSVQKTSERESRWQARAPLGGTVEWDAEILEDQPNAFLVWRSKEGSVVPNYGSVKFERASEYHGGTLVTVAMEYLPPGGKLGSMLAQMFGEEPQQQVREDLRRFKQLMETGEVLTTVGQSHGRRTAFVRMIQAAATDEPNPAEARRPSLVQSR